MPSDAARGTTAGLWLQTAVTGGRQYLAANPVRVSALTLLPRAILQTVFIVLLGDLAGGHELRRYAFIGAVALTITLSTMVGIVDVPSNDKWSGTFWRIRTGRLEPFAVFVLRSWPYPLAGFCTCLVTLVVVAPVVGLVPVNPAFLGLLPCFAVLALTTSAAGLAAGALAVGRRADVLVANFLAYVTMLCSGAVLPPGHIRWVDLIGEVLPMRHGLAAIRAVHTGQPFARELGTEVAVGAAWFAVAWVLVHVQTRRARASGNDDYA